LELELRAIIEAEGPMPVSRYMALCLGHPRYGYYATRDPIGAAGDFITAPEISQMFGELIGLWCSVVWRSMGAPDPVILCELGPGRGTLMADLLRAAALDVAFRRALRVHLVEISPALRNRQAATLADARPIWHDDLATLPAGPLLAVGNEFFDALPIRQFVRRAGAWRERVVDLADNGFAFVDGPSVEIAAPPAKEGDLFERGDAACVLAERLGARIADRPGAALVIDYGHTATAPGETLQAVARHASADVLADPGTADLTAHVDFQALANAALPARAWGPVNQGAFLRGLGIELRAERLMLANPECAASIEAGCRRLIDAAEMGTLFKVMAISHPSLPAPPGFED